MARAWLGHVVVVAVALELRPDAQLYADLPRAAIYGLPEWGDR